MGEGVQTGLVGFFDILGYKNLLERNEPEIIADEVIPILTGIQSDVAGQIQSMISFLGSSEETIDKMNKIIESIQWLVFSDTVLITMPINSIDDVQILTSWTFFLSSAILLQIKLFNSGLPVRGAIDYGKFYIKQQCFAGRTIVKAYEICNQLELAACVLSNDAAKEHERYSEIVKRLNIKPQDAFVTDYLVPLKEQDKLMPTVTAETYYSRTDIRNQVLRAFWANNKDIPRSVQAKINNTEQWLQFLSKRSGEKELKEFLAKNPPPTPPK
jgi:hypothetical protein